MLDYLLFRIPSLRITFLINNVHPTLFCLQHHSVTGRGDGSDQGGGGWGGNKTKNGTSAQMTARSIKNGGSLGLLECFCGGGTTQARRNGRRSVRTPTTNVEKVCVLFQDGRCRCENTCWQVGFGGKMHSYSFFTPFGSLARTSADVCRLKVFRSERSCISPLIIKWLKNVQ